MGWRDRLRGGLTALSKAIEDDEAEDVHPEQMKGALERLGLGVDQPEGAAPVKVNVADPTTEVPRAMFHDPYSVMDWGGWRQRPSALTYETLRQMSASNTIIAAIIALRETQVASFAKPQQGKHDRGFRVILRDRRNKKKGMTPIEQREAEGIERMLQTTAVLLPHEKPADRDSFRAFLKKATRDVLTYDQWCFEKIRDRAGRPSRFIALPSETIRPAVSDVEHMDPAELRSRVSYVQVYENTIISEFSTEQLAWCIMHPRSDIRVNGFGYSPIEQIVRLVTAWLFGFEYNTRFFTQGSAIKGLINIKGAIPDRQLRAFRRMWYSMISGVNNAWKTPIVNAEEIQWLSMHSTNREMEYGQWMDWLTKLICAIFQADPVEINFIFGNSGQTSSLNQSRPNAEELTEAKDKGLQPLLDHLADHINTHIIWDLNEDFEFAFEGLDEEAAEKEREANDKEVRGWKTVNEIRAQNDEEPLPGNQGDVILDSNWMQWATQQQQMAQQATMGMGGGMPGQGDNHFDDLFGPGHGQNDEDEEGGDKKPGGFGQKPGGPPQGAQQPPGAMGAGPKPPGSQGPPGAKPGGFGQKPLGGPPGQQKPPGAQQEGTGSGAKKPPFQKSRVASRLEAIDLWLPRGGE